MENSNLIYVLRSFSKKEFRDLKKWMQSPAHNQRDDVIKLFDYINSGGRLFKEKALKKEKIFPRIFPGENFDDAKIRQVIHFFLKSVEDFLIYQEIHNDEVGSKMKLAMVYRKRKLEKPFQKTIKSVKELQEKYPYRNENFLRNEYLLQQEEYTYLEGQKRNIKMNLQEVSDALDLTFLADKLRQSCLMLAHQAVYKAGYQIGLLDEVLKYVEEKDFLNHPAIAIYYYIYKATKDKENPSYFQSLKLLIFDKGHFFPASEIRDIYLMAINYCIGKINAGDKDFIREAFEMYRLGFEKKVLMENQYVSRWTFLNVILIALRLKEFQWVRDFIPRFEQYLETQYRENFVHYSKARLFFEEKDYDSAMRLLASVEYDDILINLNAKSMLLKIFYEQDEIDALESLLESMRTYMQRKKVMGYHQSNYKNIIRYTRKLTRINPYNKEQKQQLKEEIQTANPLTEREWLIEQLEKA